MTTTNPNHTLAATLAPHLGPDWTARPDHNHALLTRLDGLSLSLSTTGDRAVISAAMQKSTTGYRYYDTYRNIRPQITCARRRGPQAIAADIQRRLLPHVEESYPKECAYIKEIDAGHDYQQRARHLLAQVGQGYVATYNDHQVCDTYAFGIRPSWKADVSTRPEYGIKLAINYLDLETAAQILEILASASASNLATA